MAEILGDPVVRRFYPAVASLADTNRSIDKAIARTHEHGYHFAAVERRADGALLGLCGLGTIDADLRAALPGHPAIEIGWQLDQACWGQGIAPEAAAAWLDYAWQSLELDEVVAFTARINLPSQRVMQKIGMNHSSADDFEHPNLPEGHALRPQVLYRIGNPNRFSPASPQ